MKNKVLKEVGYLIISILLVLLAYSLSGYFFQVWINDIKMLAILTIAFYLIIGFYRVLNYMARKYRDDE